MTDWGIILSLIAIMGINIPNIVKAYFWFKNRNNRKVEVEVSPMNYKEINENGRKYIKLNINLNFYNQSEKTIFLKELQIVRGHNLRGTWFSINIRKNFNIPQDHLKLDTSIKIDKNDNMGFFAKDDRGIVKLTLIFETSDGRYDFAKVEASAGYGGICIHKELRFMYNFD